MGIPFGVPYLQYALQGGIYTVFGECINPDDQTALTYPSWAGFIYLRGLRIGLEDELANLGFNARERVRRANESKVAHFWNVRERTKGRQ